MSVLLAEGGGDSATLTFVTVGDLSRLSNFSVSVDMLGQSTRSVSSAVLVAPTDVWADFFALALVRRRLGAACGAVLVFVIIIIDLLFLWA